MSECKTCGVDIDEVLARMKARIAQLDLLLWNLEFADHE